MGAGAGENPWKDLDAQIEQLMRCQPLPEAEASPLWPSSVACSPSFSGCQAITARAAPPGRLAQLTWTAEASCLALSA